MPKIFKFNLIGTAEINSLFHRLFSSSENFLNNQIHKGNTLNASKWQRQIKFCAGRYSVNNEERHKIEIAKQCADLTDRLKNMNSKPWSGEKLRTNRSRPITKSIPVLLIMIYFNFLR